MQETSRRSVSDVSLLGFFFFSRPTTTRRHIQRWPGWWRSSSRVASSSKVSYINMNKHSNTGINECCGARNIQIYVWVKVQIEQCKCTPLQVKDLHLKSYLNVLKLSKVEEGKSLFGGSANNSGIWDVTRVPVSISPYISELLSSFRAEAQTVRRGGAKRAGRPQLISWNMQDQHRPEGGSANRDWAAAA